MVPCRMAIPGPRLKYKDSLCWPCAVLFCDKLGCDSGLIKI